MKRLLLAAAFVAASAPLLAADVAMSVSIGQPGFYGQLDIGDYPPPRVIYRQPMMIERVDVDRRPIYLRVPPGHAKNWRKHCREYNACGERVYFVQNNWYQKQYVPQYRERHGEYRDDHQDNRQDNHRNDHNNGNRNGNKHDKGGNGNHR